jgi:hypothetical protein
MKYLCLIYDEEKKLETMPASQMGALMGECRVFSEAIRHSGNYVASHQLQPSQNATTVRIRNGRVSATDGPFAETKEQLGGYFLINARDLNEAIQIAARIPAARIGSVEVRPVVEQNT